MAETADELLARARDARLRDSSRLAAWWALDIRCRAGDLPTEWSPKPTPKATSD